MSVYPAELYNVQLKRMNFNIRRAVSERYTGYVAVAVAVRAQSERPATFPPHTTAKKGGAQPRLTVFLQTDDYS